MARVHLICRGGLHLRPIKFPLFESGYWDIGMAEAQRLLGGMLFLHERKSEPSYFGGTVRDVRLARSDEGFDGRIVFTILSQREGKNAKWEGADHAMAWTSGVLD